MFKKFATTVRNWKQEQYQRRYHFVYLNVFNWFYNVYKLEIPQDVIDLPPFHYKNLALKKAKDSTERYMAMVVMKRTLNKEYERALRTA